MCQPILRIRRIRAKNMCNASMSHVHRAYFPSHSLSARMRDPRERVISHPRPSPSKFSCCDASENIKPIEAPMTLPNVFHDLDEGHRSSSNSHLIIRVSSVHFECFASHESVNIRISNPLRCVVMPIEPQYDETSCTVEKTDGIGGLDALWFDTSPSISGAEEISSIICKCQSLQIVHSTFNQ